MNPIMQKWFGNVGVERRQQMSYQPLDDGELFVRYVHYDMWFAFLNGNDHAAIVTACALLEHAIKDAVHFDAFLNADKHFDREQWDRIEGMAFHSIVEYGSKRLVLSDDQVERLLEFKTNYRNKWMHGETPAYVKDARIPEVFKIDIPTETIEKVSIDLGDDPTFQRIGRILADRDHAPHVVWFVDREVRTLVAASECKNKEWNHEHGDTPPTKEQMDRILTKMREQYGDNALDGLTLFGGHRPPADDSDTEP